AKRRCEYELPGADGALGCDDTGKPPIAAEGSRYGHAQAHLAAAPSDLVAHGVRKRPESTFEVGELLRARGVARAAAQHELFPHPDSAHVVGERRELGLDQRLPDHTIGVRPAQRLEPVAYRQMLDRAPVADAADLKHEEPEANAID